LFISLTKDRKGYSSSTNFLRVISQLYTNNVVSGRSKGAAFLIKERGLNWKGVFHEVNFVRPLSHPYPLPLLTEL